MSEVVIMMPKTLLGARQADCSSSVLFLMAVRKLGGH